VRRVTETKKTRGAGLSAEGDRPRARVGHSCSCAECPPPTHPCSTHSSGASWPVSPQKKEQRSPAGKPTRRSRIAYRRPGEADEGHPALQAVSCQRDGLEDVTQLRGHVHLLSQFQQILHLLQGLWERGSFAGDHDNLHAQRLGTGENGRIRNGVALNPALFPAATTSDGSHLGHHQDVRENDGSIQGESPERLRRGRGSVSEGLGPPPTEELDKHVGQRVPQGLHNLLGPRGVARPKVSPRPHVGHTDPSGDSHL